MARSMGFSVGARGRHLRAWTEALAALKRRVFETLGFGLLLGALLVAAALFSYDPRDPSLDTAVDSGAHNFLGYDGAVLADILRQSLGLAAFVIPIVLFGWSLRLLLDRPLRSLWRKLGLLPAALVLAALALSILDQSALCAAPGCGGAVGWGLQRLLAAGRARNRGIADRDDGGSRPRPFAVVDTRTFLARLARPRRGRGERRRPCRGLVRARNSGGGRVGGKAA